MSILPMHDPVLTNYNVYGAIFSIIRDEEYLPWLYDHFIGIAINTYDNTPYFTDHFSLLEYGDTSSCPWIKIERPSNRYINHIYHNTSIIDVIKDAIEDQKYVWLYLDQYYISASDVYQKKHNDHSVLVYGIDEKQQIVHIADNLSKGKFIRAVCSFEAFEQAWKSEICHHYRRFFTFLSKQKASFSFDKNKILASIKDYIYSKPIETGIFWNQIPVDGPHAYVQHKKHWIFGQTYYTYLNTLIKDTESIDIRAYHLSLEHKKCMLGRIKYLLPESSCNDHYKEIVTRASVLRNLVIKYNITGDRNLLSKIELGTDELVYLEANILKRYIHELELSK